MEKNMKQELTNALRWYQNPDLNVSELPAIALEHVQRSGREELSFVVDSSGPVSNLLDSPSRPRPTDTISARTVFHEANAAIRSLTAHIQTQEQMDDLLKKLNHLSYGLILVYFILFLILQRD